MTKVECWSISIDRSCHIGPSQTSNFLDLNYIIQRIPYIYIKKMYNLYQKDVQSNLYLDSIEAQKSEYGTQIAIDMSKAGPITPIPNPK
jgi:hypothetical protein